MLPMFCINKIPNMIICKICFNIKFCLLEKPANISPLLIPYKM